jgi:hypoxanthine phosphoribosyltransferase
LTAPAEARVLIGPDEVRAGVARIAAEIDEAHDDGLVLVAVLKGSVPFLADLGRALTIRPEVDFLAISSYAPESGRVRIVKDVDLDLMDRDVLLVEDIVDTGLTLTFLLGEIGRRSPRSLTTCALLDKRARRIVPTPVEHVGFVIPDEFVLGYGLDFAGRYRNLDHVVAGDLQALRNDPNAHVKQLYRG